MRLVLLKIQTHLSFYGCLLPERMKIQSKVRALEGSQHYPSVLRCPRGANSIVGDGILTKFKLIQALIVVLLVCKNKEDPFKMNTFLPLSVYGDFPDAQGQQTLQSNVRSGQISNPSEDLWMSMLPARMKKIQLKVKAWSGNNSSPIISLLGFFKMLKSS